MRRFFNIKILYFGMEFSNTILLINNMRRQWKGGCFIKVLKYLKEKKEKGYNEVTISELYRNFMDYSEGTIRSIVSELIHRGILEVKIHKHGRRFLRKRGRYIITDEILKIDIGEKK